MFRLLTANAPNATAASREAEIADPLSAKSTVGRSFATPSSVAPTRRLRLLGSII